MRGKGIGPILYKRKSASVSGLSQVGKVMLFKTASGDFSLLPALLCFNALALCFRLCGGLSSSLLSGGIPEDFVPAADKFL